ncbi:MAG: hypothetical protein MRY21_00625 [Simkaniaceae bacterium]|nr:hypothetical protein [Simkaniaceae bacterium]
MDKYMIAAVFGPTLILMGLSLIVLLIRGQEAIDALKDEKWSGHMQGFVCTIIGFAVIHTYNIWVWNMGILVTLFGWVMLIKGIWIMFAPKGFSICWLSNKPVIFISGLVSIAWGIALTFFAHG